jgi:hypothetical protein
LLVSAAAAAAAAEAAPLRREEDADRAGPPPSMSAVPPPGRGMGTVAAEEGAGADCSIEGLTDSSSTCFFCFCFGGEEEKR